MCWSMGATIGMVALVSAATAVTIRRGEPAAIPAALGWFTLMEGLQVAGHATAGQCDLPANQVTTVLSYLHITFQPFFINAFAMALLARPPSAALRLAVWIACGASAAIMLLQLMPFPWAGSCRAGTGMCGAPLCTIAGGWHIGWQVPFNGLLSAFDALPWTFGGHPTYLVAAFLVPLAYGAWRFVAWHALSGPVLATLLTRDPREMPAVWCLFSIGIILVALSPWLRARVAPPR